LIVWQGFEIGESINRRQLAAEETDLLLQLLGVGHVTANDNRQSVVTLDLLP
jgi:hypothetical protein